MSRILALDTSTDACSAALLLKGELYDIFEIQPRKHTELILGMIERLLGEADITPSQLDAIAFGRGPGAFTGVRIATACTQGLAYAADLPVLPISTLASMAQYVIEKYGGAQMAVCLDARMDEVYCGMYTKNAAGQAELSGDELVCPPQNMPTQPWSEWQAVGNGWKAYPEALDGAFPSAPQQRHADIYPTAKTIAKLGATAFAQGAAIPVDQALPIYLRHNVAKKKGEQKRSAGNS